MNRLRGDMDRLFGRVGPGDGRRLWAAEEPQINLWEDNDNLYVESELPGLEMNDLEIYVNGDNQLSINGQRRQLSIEHGRWHRQERRFGSFTRLFDLPTRVNPDQVQAEFKHGVLTLTMPKSEESKARRISVKAE
jgi:HSP20 family protein